MDNMQQQLVQGISVIICCYNSEKKIAATLAYLSKQQAINAVSFELLIIDNNCTDDTVDLAINTWNTLNNPFPLRVINEKKAGLNFARRTGITNAQYSYIVLCDDDNWLSDNYLSRLYLLFETMPSVAVIGGVGQAVSDVCLPSWFKAVDGFGYAVGNEGRHTGFTQTVYGAGMGLRKNIYLSIFARQDFTLTDRQAGSLSSGGDTEICLKIKEAGYQVYLDEQLTFQHFINKERLTWNYYLRLRRSFGKANALLTKKNSSPKTFNLKSYLLTARFAMKNITSLLFSHWQKNKKTAEVMQEWSRRLHSINH